VSVTNLVERQVQRPRIDPDNIPCGCHVDYRSTDEHFHSEAPHGSPNAPLVAYLNYLTLRYAILLRFLPANHVLAPKAAYSGTAPRADYPSRLRMSTLIHALAPGRSN
jgi:hypothetical protein